MSQDEILETLKAHKSLIEKRFKIVRMGLFGSYAKNTNHAQSDVDLLYELKYNHHLGLSEMVQLEAYLSNLLQTERIDLVNHRYMNPIVRHEIEPSVIYV